MRRFTPSGSRLTSMPPTRAVPDDGRSNPHSMRMVVDLPAPLAPRKPKISPCFTENDRSSTATNDPKRRDRPRTSMATADPPAWRDMSLMARATQERVRDGLRPIARSRALASSASSASSSATCATSTSVLVATPAANRSATTRRASAALLMRIQRAALTIAWLVCRSSSRCRTSAAHNGVELGEALAGGEYRRRRFGRLRLGAAEIEEVPVEVDADVPRLLPFTLARKVARVRVGVVDATDQVDGRLVARQRRLLPRFEAAKSKRPGPSVPAATRARA